MLPSEPSEAIDMEVWVEREIEGCEFPDQRLKTRFGKLLGQLGAKIGESLPTACQDWAATKAAYRFFGNPRVDESIILAGHFAATKSRIAAAKGPILMLHDTTEFSYQRARPEKIGKTHIIKDRKDRPGTFTVCGRVRSVKHTFFFGRRQVMFLVFSRWVPGFPPQTPATSVPREMNQNQ
ncbi:MAG: transposase, partial [Planctomycetota bacterium]